LVGSFDP